MKSNPILDIESMMTHYKIKPEDLTAKRLAFRFDLLQEEFNELDTARTNLDAAETVDALIDITVIALGTLYLAGVDLDQAWSTVQKANMSKLKGTKPGRVSDGWDLYKPLDWTSPDHSQNTGNLIKLMENSND